MWWQLRKLFSKTCRLFRPRNRQTQDTRNIICVCKTSSKKLLSVECSSTKYKEREIVITTVAISVRVSPGSGVLFLN